MHQAVAQGLRWGSDIAHTYGPLGFLSVSTPYLGFTSTFALAFTVAVYVAAAAAVALYAFRFLPAWLAVVAAIGIVRLFPDLAPFEMVQVLAFIWCVEVCRRSGVRGWPIIAIGMGLLVGLLVLGKLNVALLVGAMGLVAATRLTSPWWWGVAVYAVTIPPTIVVFWLVAGQRLVDLPQFASTSVEIVRGHSESMGIELFPQPPLLYGLMLACAILLAFGASLSWRAFAPASRIALGLLALLFAFGTWKGAFVRSDGHVASAFVSAAIVALPLLAADRLARLRAPALAVTILSAILITGASPASYLDVGGSVQVLSRALADAFVPGRQAAAVEAVRVELQAQYRLEPGILALLTGQTTHIDPLEAAIAFAYPDIRWDPLLTIQSYLAYMPALDEANADRLRGPTAPQRILRERYVRENGDLVSIDHRNPWFDTPAAALEMLCRYEEIAASPRWQVLGRSARSCGTPEALGSIRANLGEPVSVPVDPRADRFVIVRIGGLGPSAVDQIASALWRGREWYITIDGARYRLVAPLAGDGLIMAVPASLMSSAAFAFGGPVRSLSVESGPSLFGPAATITYDFYSVPWNDAP